MTRISAPFDRTIARIKQEMDNPTPNMEVINYLAQIGQWVCDTAARNKDTGNITGNQYEAYGYGVFFHYKRYRSGIGRDRDFHTNAAGNDNAKGVGKDPRRGKYGWSEALHAVTRHKSEAYWYELYLTNAMWYSIYHEPRGLAVLSTWVKEAMTRIETDTKRPVMLTLYDYGASSMTDDGAILMFRYNK